MIYEWILLGLRILAPLLLYSFLGYIFYQMWAEQADIKQPQAQLRSLDNPSSVWFLIAHTSLGRDNDNTIIIQDEFVSSHHATLIYKNNVWWLMDLNSTNGTRVNNVLVEDQIALTNNDIISLGNKQYQLLLKQTSIAG